MLYNLLYKNRLELTKKKIKQNYDKIIKITKLSTFIQKLNISTFQQHFKIREKIKSNVKNLRNHLAMIGNLDSIHEFHSIVYEDI